MAESWKQVFEDIINALRGGEPKRQSQAPSDGQPSLLREPESPAGESLPPTMPVGSNEAAEAPLQPEPAAARGPAIGVSAAASLEDASTPTWETTAAAELPPGGGLAPREPPAPVLPAPARVVWPGGLRTAGLAVGMAALLLVGLWVSGGYRWWARWTAPRPPASDVIATFEDGQITIADVEAHLALLVPEEYQAAARTSETLLGVVDDMVMDELVRRWAATRQPDREQEFSHTMQHISESLNLETLDQKLHAGAIQVTEEEIQGYFSANQEQFGDQSLNDVREQIRGLLVAQREEAYIEDYLQRLTDNASVSRSYDLLDVPPPVEDDLRRYYDANRDRYQEPRRAVADELQIPFGDDEAAARQDADDALLRVRSGETFAAVAKAIPQALASSGTTVAEGTRDPAWDAGVFNLTAGELSPVIRAADSFYIVRLNSLQPARIQPLEEIRTEVLAAVQQQKTQEWFAANAGRILFSLNGRQYTVGQFYQEYTELDVSTQTQYAGPEGMGRLADLLIERLLLVQDTYDQLLDVQNRPLVDEARLQVLKQMLHQEEIDDTIRPTDEEIQLFYDKNIDLMALPPTSRIRYIRIGLGQSEDVQAAARARAQEAYRKLVPGLFRQGADFSTVAQEYSEDPETAANGGEFPGSIGESDDILAEVQVHPFHEAILPLQPDEISQPIQFGDSLYIVQLIERTKPEALTLEQARPYIEEIITQQKHDERLAQLSDELFKQANVVVYDTVLLDYFSTLPTPVAPLGAVEDGSP